MISIEDKSVLLKKAQEYINRDYCVTPLIIQNGTKSYPKGHEWTKYRGHVPTAEDLKKWFVDTPDVNGIAIILDNTCLPIETDGFGETVFMRKILPQLSEEARRAILQTTHTRSPHGEHRLLKVNPSDFPNGIKEIKCDLSAKDKDEHKEIVLLSQNKIYNDYGPGYSIVVGLDKAVTVSKNVAEEIISILARFKQEFSAIKTVTASLAPFYKEPNRNALVFALSGFMYKGGVAEYLIKDTVDYLIDITGNHDVERKARLKVVEETCSKDPNSDQVSGYSKLLEAVSDKHEVVEELQQVFGQLGYFINAKRRVASPDNLNLPQEVRNKLNPHIWVLHHKVPLTLFVADTNDKTLKKVIIAPPKANLDNGINDDVDTIKTESTIYEKTKDGTTQEKSKTKTLKLMEKDIIIDAIPIHVVINDNPLDDSKTYKITWVHKKLKHRIVTGPCTINQILKELKLKGRAVLEKDAEVALQRLVNKYEDDELADINRSVNFEGYCYYDDDIQRSGKDIETRHPIRTKEECAESAQFIEELSKFYIYNEKLDKRYIVSTTLKWTIIGPFNFVIKQLTGNWMSYLGHSGERDGGKTTMSDIVLMVHGHHMTNIMFNEGINYSVSAGASNTDAKFGNMISETTFPKAINEFGTVEKYGRDGQFAETFKTAVDNILCRKGKKEGIYDYPFLSLSPLTLNGNHILTRDPAIAKRIHNFKYTAEDIHRRDDTKTKEFSKLLKERGVNDLRILGDWTINYIWDNREELLLSRRYTQYELMDIVMKKFYEFAGVPYPEWMDTWLQETALEELEIDENAIIRSILFNHILDTLSKNDRYMGLTEAGKAELVNTETRISKCLESNILSFVIQKQALDGSDVYYMDSSVLMLFENRLPDITLKRLGEKVGFTFKQMGSKRVLEFTIDQLQKFLART